MSDLRDPKIKLFGKTIELPETSGPPPAESGGADGSVQSCDAAAVEDGSNQDPPCSSSNSFVQDSCCLIGDAEEHQSDKTQLNPKQTDGGKEDRAQPAKSEELQESNLIPPMNEDAKTLSNDCDTESVKKSEDDENENGEKTLKKPDKIIPCPRCNSMETKFCYFNNYNVNQPRHFCKNCQRYWTAGGTMRNVPIGAGRRKNKNNAAAQLRHLTVPEALQGAGVDLTNGVHHPALNPNGTILAFGSDTPLCESMASVLNIADNKIRNGLRNGLVSRPEEPGSSISNGSKENGESASSVTAASLKDEQSKLGLPEPTPNAHPFPQPVPCFPGAPWPYPWNSVPWNSPGPPPTLGPGMFPLPFYPAGTPYWGCAIPGTWPIPWVIPPTPPASQSLTPSISAPNSPTLGKHSRDEKEESQKENDSERSLWVPKTLRIDDPGEAAKSSIWETLGIKNERVNSVGGNGGIFKVFASQSKGEEKMHVMKTSKILEANPAALSRSNNFREST